MEFRKIGRFALAVALCGLMNGMAAINVNAGEYSFKVHNSTNTTIKGILVSEDGKNWGNFDIGSGIKPGETSKLVWDKSTNNEECVQFVKAVFKDGSEAEPAKFDFCEKDLNLEF